MKLTIIIYGFACVSNIADVIKICNNTSNEGLSPYFIKVYVLTFQRKKQLALGKEKICK